MKEKKIKIIIGVMTAALVGLIAIQILWMLQMIEMEQKKFDINAFDAINTTIRRLEDREAVEIVREKSDEEDEDKDSVVVVKHFDRGVHVFSDNGVVSASAGDNDEDAEYLLRLVTTTGDSNGITVSVKDSASAGKVFVWNDFVKKKSALIKDVFLELYDRSRNTPISERLKPELVKKILDEELGNVGINTEFKFVVSSGEDEVLVENIIDDTDKLKNISESKFKVQLFPHEAEDDSDFLFVSFPERQSYVIGSVAWLLSFSILLIFVVSYVFYKTVVMLLNQKKITEIKNDLINNLTHEFNTPLSTIALACEAIGDPQVGSGVEKVRHFTGIINSENSRLSKLVHNLLNTASIEKGEYRLKIEQTDIRDLIEEALDELSEVIKSNSANVDFEIPENELNCECDKFHIKNSIKNLIDNAVKYSGENPEIKVIAAGENGEISVAVVDNGPGIPKREMKRIFDTFYRIPKGNLHDVKGYGVGLSYVKNMAEAHGGSVSVEEVPEGGSKFVFKIPARK